VNFRNTANEIKDLAKLSYIYKRSESVDISNLQSSVSFDVLDKSNLQKSVKRNIFTVDQDG
jgi:hypothetical protein